MQVNIRNFCIIAHIDHGKSTLADRLLEVTDTVEQRELKEQTLDQMDLERERGITIKLQPVKINYNYQGVKYDLNLIDTPGHVDFAYEVSRSLAAVDGAILLIDATQGIQAQTLANLYMALNQDLVIIPVINKIDLPNAQIEQTKKAIYDLLGGSEDILLVSGKTGQGVDKLLEAIVEKVPAPKGEPEKPSRALIFDSNYDTYKGVVAYVRVVDGEFKQGQEIYVAGTKTQAEVLELGIFKPKLTKKQTLKTGQIGYIATGLKDVKNCRVGDTLMSLNQKEKTRPLKGYREVKPMVFASFYPKDADQYNLLRDALDRLSLNDASFVFKPESSKALGRGFRGGFLGLLHLEIIQERLKREFNLDLVFTVPTVKYKLKLRANKLPSHLSEKKTDEKGLITIHSPQELPNPAVIEKIFEPYVELEIICLSDYLGNIMEYMSKKRSIYIKTDYLDANRIVLVYELPLQEVITNLHDALKTVTKGYASINYKFTDFRAYDLVRLDFLIAGEAKEELARIVPREKARRIGKAVLEKLKEHLPRQNFAVALQAGIGGKVIARENISALKKDVLAKLYGGDRTRKDKLLKKQKKGKKRMKDFGRVEIPSSAYMKIMKD
ncbi:MAG: elongation factor 4 [Candidatus Moranbacteria bacterium]|nr:elongation factor 4 [Candidatus Moranbacteria bacterium]